ncbi:hypothetical protein PYW08_002786 [Mythimna loreyi]|uniref:Uncharacterized protein n=1 Tax=Mythimna loreyi TaxID=667449 RepID=A0ACC2QP17_9NEOP|nr:hypothetical protein PYW08_002786 [Mythimna loreyi]
MKNYYQMPWEFRDVSKGLARLREFLLGRKNVNPHRFPPQLSPRSIPPPDIPRGEDKYSDHYYYNRDALNSVKPPVVAPVGPVRIFPFMKSLQFPSELPTPGCVWWFDAHCYYKEIYQEPCGPTPTVPGPPKSTCPCPQTPGSPPPKEAAVVKAVEKAVEKPVCKLEAGKRLDPKPTLAEGVCEPCCKKEKKKG